MQASDNNSIVLQLTKTLRAHRSAVQTATMVIFILIFTSLSMSAPIYEWDLLPYMANALHIVSGQSTDALHAPIYENLMQSIPPDSYEKLVGSPTRMVLSQDPEAFRQTAAFFYDSRVIYTYINAAFIKLGFNPISVIYTFSVVCAVISSLLLSRLVPVRAPLGVYFVLPFIALSCGLLTVARIATPDSLATLTTITLYFLLIRNRVLLLLFLLPMTIFVRSDLIILTGLFFAYFFFTNRISKFAVVASAIATVAAYLVLNYVIIEHDAWSSLIGYNFGDKPTHPAEYEFTVTISGYFSYIMEGLVSFSYNPIFFVFCMFAVTGIVQYSSRFFFTHGRTKVSLQHIDILFLLVSCAAFLGLHFLLFPVTWTRFFAAQYSLVAVVVVWTTLAILAERNYSTRDSMDLLKS